MKTLILVTADRAEILADPGDPAPIKLDAPEASLLLYGAAPADLDLAVGPLPLVGPEEPNGQPLPPPDRSYVLRGDALIEMPLPEAVTAMRVRPPCAQLIAETVPVDSTMSRSVVVAGSLAALTGDNRLLRIDSASVTPIPLPFAVRSFVEPAALVRRSGFVLATAGTLAYFDSGFALTGTAALPALQPALDESHGISGLASYDGSVLHLLRTTGEVTVIEGGQVSSWPAPTDLPPQGRDCSPRPYISYDARGEVLINPSTGWNYVRTGTTWSAQPIVGRSAACGGDLVNTTSFGAIALVSFLRERADRTPVRLYQRQGDAWTFLVSDERFSPDSVAELGGHLFVSGADSIQEVRVPKARAPYVCQGPPIVEHYGSIIRALADQLIVHGSPRTPGAPRVFTRFRVVER